MRKTDSSKVGLSNSLGNTKLNSLFHYLDERVRKKQDKRHANCQSQTSYILEKPKAKRAIKKSINKRAPELGIYESLQWGYLHDSHTEEFSRENSNLVGGNWDMKVNF